MPNHPNRSRRGDSPARTPSPEEIRAAREAAGLTQTEAAGLVHASMRAWQQWEAGNRRMHPAIWELWRIKASARIARDALSLPALKGGASRAFR